MQKDEKFNIDKVRINEIKKEIMESLQRYIDLKLKPVMNYFEKKKDYYEMSFL